MYSAQNSFLFIHVPKTAGNAIQSALDPYSEDELVRVNRFQDGVERFEVQRGALPLTKHSTLQQYRTSLGTQAIESAFTFVGVRNPWERYVSLYFSPHRRVRRWRRRTFKRLLEESQALPHYVGLTDQSNEDPIQNVDFVIRFESLQSDFDTVCERIGIPAASLPVRNKSSRDDYVRYYDDELVELVRRKCSYEIQRLGYTFG